MKILKSAIEVNIWRQQLSGTVGFVPTMGALHLGHRSLLERARQENENVALSIFVNPTQFNNSSDFQHYPATWREDLLMAESVGVDMIFAPLYQSLYPDDYRYKVSEAQFSKLLCGEHRPGHFDGVLTVVMKLFNIVRPHKAYFGEKDYQQLELIRGMVDSFFMNIEIVPCPTLRETDGLAMSSRNLRLTPEQRQLAPMLFQTISTAKTADEARDILGSKGFSVDYVVDLDRRRFVAATLGDVRLIDNVAV